MSIRNIRKLGDEILSKKAKPVTEVNDKIRELISDMLDTMYESEGVGLAAPQVGILKRIVVIDTSEDCNSPIVLINPEIIETDGEQRSSEGCLSVPGKVGIVTRPQYVKIAGYNENMDRFELEGTDLLARAFVHEIDHLDGKMYVDLVEGELYNVEDLVQEDND